MQDPPTPFQQVGGEAGVRSLVDTRIPPELLEQLHQAFLRTADHI